MLNLVRVCAVGFGACSRLEMRVVDALKNSTAAAGDAAVRMYDTWYDIIGPGSINCTASGNREHEKGRAGAGAGAGPRNRVASGKVPLDKDYVRF